MVTLTNGYLKGLKMTKTPIIDRVKAAAEQYANASIQYSRVCNDPMKGDRSALRAHDRMIAKQTRLWGLLERHLPQG